MLRAIDNKDRWIATRRPRRRARCSRATGSPTRHGSTGASTNSAGCRMAARCGTCQRGKRVTRISTRWTARAAAQLTPGQLGSLAAVSVSRDGRHASGSCATAARPATTRSARSTAAGGEVRELTALDGVEDFTLSPDGTQAAGAPFAGLPAAAAVGGGCRRRRGARASPIPAARTSRRATGSSRRSCRCPASTAPAPSGASSTGRKRWSRAGSIPIVMFVHGAGYLQNVRARYPNYFREQMFHNLLVRPGLPRARPRLPRQRRLRPRLAHRDLPLDGQAGTGGLPRRPRLAGGNEAGRSRPRRHLRRQLRRLHDLHGAVPEARRVQGRRRAAPGQRLVAVQPRIHQQHPQHARARSRGLQAFLADRIRRRACRTIC